MRLDVFVTEVMLLFMHNFIPGYLSSSVWMDIIDQDSDV